MSGCVMNSSDESTLPPSNLQDDAHAKNFKSFTHADESNVNLACASRGTNTPICEDSGSPHSPAVACVPSALATFATLETGALTSKVCHPEIGGDAQAELPEKSPVHLCKVSQSMKADRRNSKSLRREPPIPTQDSTSLTLSRDTPTLHLLDDGKADFTLTSFSTASIVPVTQSKADEAIKTRTDSESKTTNKQKERTTGTQAIIKSPACKTALEKRISRASKDTSCLSATGPHALQVAKAEALKVRKRKAAKRGKTKTALSKSMGAGIRQRSGILKRSKKSTNNDLPSISRFLKTTTEASDLDWSEQNYRDLDLIRGVPVTEESLPSFAEMVQSSANPTLKPRASVVRGNNPSKPTACELAYNLRPDTIKAASCKERNTLNGLGKIIVPRTLAELNAENIQLSEEVLRLQGELLRRSWTSCNERESSSRDTPLTSRDDNNLIFELARDGSSEAALQLEASFLCPVEGAPSTVLDASRDITILSEANPYVACVLEANTFINSQLASEVGFSFQSAVAVCNVFRNVHLKLLGGLSQTRFGNDDPMNPVVRRVLSCVLSQIDVMYGSILNPKGKVDARWGKVISRDLVENLSSALRSLGMHYHTELQKVLHHVLTNIALMFRLENDDQANACVLVHCNAVEVSMAVIVSYPEVARMISLPDMHTIGRCNRLFVKKAVSNLAQRSLDLTD